MQLYEILNSIYASSITVQYRSKFHNPQQQNNSNN